MAQRTRGEQQTITFRGKRFTPRQVADLMDRSDRRDPDGRVVVMLNGVPVECRYERIIDDLAIHSTRDRAHGIALAWIETRGWRIRHRSAFLRLRWTTPAPAKRRQALVSAEDEHAPSRG